MKRRILIIDDELSTCTFLSLSLRKQYDVKYETTADAGLVQVKERPFDLILLDYMIGGTDGIEVLKEIKAYDENIAVIMMTAYSSIKTSVEAIKCGAYHYLAKPLDINELIVFIEQAIAHRKREEEIDYLTDELNRRNQFSEIIGGSDRMKRIFELIDKVKDVNASVTICGESGTGKELVARAIHYSGRRQKERFVVINCAAIPANLLEDELFGHKKGAFTGAAAGKKGKFEIADRGSIFLDEIGDMPLELQSKLLRVLQQKEFTPIGEVESRTVDVRIIAATNRDLEKMVEEGAFREDLYYRINVVRINMPALRERKEDIPALCNHFIRQFNAEQNKTVKDITKEAKYLLKQYAYPGNVRQLANIIESAMILCDGHTVTVRDLPEEMKKSCRRRSSFQDADTLDDWLSEKSMKEIERRAIMAALKKYGGKREATASSLGISVRTLQNKIAEYDLR